MKKFLKKVSGARNAQRSAKIARKDHFSVRKWDPLFVIFERHLYDFNYDSRELFIQGVVEEYLGYLQQQKVLVPAVWKGQLEASLTEEVSDMLVRKLYGCLNVQEFKDKLEENPEALANQKAARKRYYKLVG